MNIKEMVATYLKEKGYDGLYNEEGGCSCPLDDLISCDECPAEGGEAGVLEVRRCPTCKSGLHCECCGECIDEDCLMIVPGEPTKK